MSIYFLEDEIRFPHPSLADKDGLLAVGGDLSPDRLLLAYTNGIFPWFEEGSSILWWSPDPRMILIPGDFKMSKSLLQTIRRGTMEVKFDFDFPSVISACSVAGKREEEGTWITGDMIAAYTRLHEMGFAHCVGTYINGELIGGLYGVSIGKAFFGESMFYWQRDASKVALAALVDRMLEWGFHFIDAQQRTEHLRRLGARPVPRNMFLDMLEVAVSFPTVEGKW
jgi:leucyl/phenylalanyl-tRNA--protein transferase